MNAKTASVVWHVDAIVECPYCEAENDFMEIDEWWVFVELASNSKVNDMVINCKNCNREIVINESIY